MRRRGSSLIDVGHVLLETADSTIAHVKRGVISVLMTSLLALLFAELIGALAVVIGQWAITGTVSLPEAIELQASLVTPVACGLVLLLSIVNLLRLVSTTCLQAVRSAVASAQLHRVSVDQRDADLWPMTYGTDSYYVVPAPMVPTVPTVPLLPYHQSRPVYRGEQVYRGEPGYYEEPSWSYPDTWVPSHARVPSVRPYAAPRVMVPYGCSYRSASAPAPQQPRSERTVA